MKTKSQRIPITLHRSAGVKYCDNEPLTFGVPFADGVLPADVPIRAVTADGRELPIQTSCMTTWNKDLRFVKWLLVDTQCDPSHDVIHLEYDAESAALEHAFEDTPPLTATAKCASGNGSAAPSATSKRARG